MEEENSIIIWDSVKYLPILNYFNKNQMQKRATIISRTKVQVDNDMVKFITLEEKSFLQLVKLYHTYEFSDQVVMVSDQAQYPGILNYLTTGLLTEEQFWKAVLH